MTRRPGGSPLAFARWALDVWAEVVLSREDEQGWPGTDSLEGARQAAKTGTNTKGAAAWRGTVEVGKRLVPREPPRMPKDTRAKPGSRPPSISRHRIADEVHRQLGELPENIAWTLRVHYLRRDLTVHERARLLKVSRSAYLSHWRCGMWWMAGRLGAVEEGRRRIREMRDARPLLEA